jgi:hypothetical protein
MISARRSMKLFTFTVKDLIAIDGKEHEPDSNS